MRREREEPRLLLRQDLRDGVIALLGMRPLVRDLVAPPPKLRIEVVDVAKGAGGEEGVPQVLNLALDFAFLVPAAGRTGAGREVIVTRELEQAGVKANRAPLPFEHGALEVVVDQGARDPAIRLEGLDMAPEKTLERLVEREEGTDRPRVRQHHREAGERPRAVADPDRAKRAPIDLGLFRRQRGQAPVDHGAGLRSDHAHEAAQLDHRARVPARPHHLVEARGAQPRILGERVAHEGQVRVESGGTTHAATHGLGVGNGGLHGLMVDAKGGADGADGPVFAVIEATNLGVLFGRDHQGPPGARRGPATAPRRATDFRADRRCSGAWPQQRAAGVRADRPVRRGAV